jgi:transketolase
MTTTTDLGYADLAGLMARMTGDEKHDPAAHSTLDVVWTLYDRVLDIPSPDHPDRDRFYLSKGHGPVAYYAVLAAKGFIPIDTLDGFAGFTSPLGHHPDHRLIPGVEISSGSLGHGLALAIGATVGRVIRGVGGRSFVLMGDGELDEGSVHEAIALAGRLGLGRLTVVVVDNRSSLHGWEGGIAPRFEVEDWEADVVDGRDHDALAAALDAPHLERPKVVVAEVAR